MLDRARWLLDLDQKASATPAAVDGLVPVCSFQPSSCPPDVVPVMEKAADVGATAVFFEAGRDGRPPMAQAFVFVSDGDHDDDRAFAELHRRLWSWGGVPLLYRRVPGAVQLFRCAHKPDFLSADGIAVCRPHSTLLLAGSISAALDREPWWDADRLRSGTLWDDPAVCKQLLAPRAAAHKRLLAHIHELTKSVDGAGILPERLRDRLLVITFLIAYLEEREVLQPTFFDQFLPGSTKFFQVLENGVALVAMLDALEERFNGNVFTLSSAERATLESSSQLTRFARLVEGRQERGGQLTLWQLYSFRDLPVELLSRIYQIFVDAPGAVYTPPFLVRLVLDEVLSWERLDRLAASDEVVLDPSCGSGVFLVEAYKRIVLHWRSRNGWEKPRTRTLKALLERVHGFDTDGGALELSAFSLILALCEALEPETIRRSIKLFPVLLGRTLHHQCFFGARNRGDLKRVGVVVGNPPFASKLTTDGARESCEKYEAQHGPLPDQQVGYLFLHDAMNVLVEGGVLGMIQQYNFLYNQQSARFRRAFMSTWDVREVLDFVSVRGLFARGGADTKIVVVVAEASRPVTTRRILHATFRRTKRVESERGFDIDYYDLHWVPRDVAIASNDVWRANLLGGARVLSFVARLRSMRTLAEYAESEQWDFGEGFIEGARGVGAHAAHIAGEPLLPSDALTLDGVDRGSITRAADKPIEGPRTAARFTPPLLLIREQMDLPHAVWTSGYLTYKNKIVGFAAPKKDTDKLIAVSDWLTEQARPLRAFVAATSVRMFTQKATTLSGADIFALPYPEDRTLDLSVNERIVIDDIVDFCRDLIRLGEDSACMQEDASDQLGAFVSVFATQINGVYRDTPIRALEPHRWAGFLCQPLVFGGHGRVSWADAAQLREHLGSLMYEQRGSSLSVTRICRLYEGRFVFLLKPDTRRYWLRSVALRDADDVLADLRAQGF